MDTKIFKLLLKMKNKKQFWIGFTISLFVHGLIIGSFFSFQNKPKNMHLHQKHSTSMSLSLSAFQKSQIEPVETKTKESEPIQKKEVVKKPSQHPKKEQKIVEKESAMVSTTQKVTDSEATNHANILYKEEQNHEASTNAIAQQTGLSGIEAKDTFLSEIQAIIEKNKTYPKWARKMHIEGTVMLEFEISQEGKLLWTKVLSTSGNMALDEHALFVLQKASEEFPNPPIKKIIKLPMEYKFL
jgi:periplasmic protein TonB